MSSTVSATFFSIFFICSFRILSFASGDPGLGAQELKTTKRKHKSVQKNFVRAGNALVALKRLSKSESSIKENSIKLESLIKKLSDDRDYNFKIIKVNSKG